MARGVEEQEALEKYMTGLRRVWLTNYRKEIMKTLVASPFEDDAAELLAWGYGRIARTVMENCMTLGQRTGQAFMNTLREYDLKEYARIAASPVDPFYDDAKLSAALDLLTSK
jgi:hypothetical protein